MSQVIITFTASSTSRDLELTVTLDDDIRYQASPAAQGEKISLSIDDTQDGEHTLELRLGGKTTAHTQIDEQGNLLHDELLTIADFAFDDIRLGHVLVEHAVYEHDFNGSQDPIQDQFYGSMGCNGRVILRFSTPVYIWLLENM